MLENNMLIDSVWDFWLDDYDLYDEEEVEEKEKCK